MKTNQYQAKLTHTTDGTIVSFFDGEDEVFRTTPIPARLRLVGDIVHSSLEVAIAFGMITPPNENGD